MPSSKQLHNGFSQGQLQQRVLCLATSLSNKILLSASHAFVEGCCEDEMRTSLGFENSLDSKDISLALAPLTLIYTLEPSTPATLAIAIHQFRSETLQH